METIRYDFQIRRGESFAKDIYFTDDTGAMIALDGKEAKGQIRSIAGSAEVLAEFNFNIQSTGEVNFWLTREQSKALPVGDHEYDIVIFDSVDADCVLAGKFSVMESITDVVSVPVVPDDEEIPDTTPEEIVNDDGEGEEEEGEYIEVEVEDDNNGGEPSETPPSGEFYGGEQEDNGEFAGGPSVEDGGDNVGTGED